MGGLEGLVWLSRVDSHIAVDDIAILSLSRLALDCSREHTLPATGLPAMLAAHFFLRSARDFVDADLRLSEFYCRVIFFHPSASRAWTVQDCRLVEPQPICRKTSSYV